LEDFQRESVSREDNIKMGFKEIGYNDVDWILLAQDTVQLCERRNELSRPINGAKFLDQLSKYQLMDCCVGLAR
jgi:hypothetical protein